MKNTKDLKDIIIWTIPIAITLMTNGVELGDGLNWLFGAEIFTWDEPTHSFMIGSTIYQIYKIYKSLIKKIIELIDKKNGIE